MELIHSIRARLERPGAAGLCRLLEAAAGEHAALLGVGIGDLRREGRAWMLARLGLRARRWPEKGEEVEIRTWPSRRSAGARAWREFEVLSGGAPVAEAATVWLIVDLERRRPVRLPQFLLELPFPARDTGVEFTDAPAPGGAPSLAAQWRVQPAHLDVNDHVNNVTYIEWGEQEAGGAPGTALQADYLGEARLGDPILCLSWSQWEGRRWVQVILSGDRTCAALQWWQADIR